LQSTEPVPCYNRFQGMRAQAGLAQAVTLKRKQRQAQPQGYIK
ncbi:unnamed protein product, partial [marine sediment metagenome]